MALTPLCCCVLESLVSLLDGLALVGERPCQNQPRCLLGAGTLICAAPFLPVQPLFFGSCSYRGPATQKISLLTFPTCKISSSPGGTNWTVLDLPWDRWPHGSPSWGNAGAPQTRQAMSPVLCASSSSLRSRGPGGSVWGALGDGEHRPSSCSSFALRSFTPTRGDTNQHQSVQHQCPPSFPPSSSQQAQDPQHLQKHHPGSPARYPLSPRSLPREQRPPSWGGAYLHTLCFPFRTAWRALGVQPHTGSSSEEGAGVPGWHQGRSPPVPSVCGGVCEHGQPSPSSCSPLVDGSAVPPLLLSLCRSLATCRFLPGGNLVRFSPS